MTISKQKALILPEIMDLLATKGFNYDEGFEHVFTKTAEYGGIKISLFFSDLGESNNSLFSLSHKVIEDVILAVGVPYNNWSKQKKGLKLLYTVYDNITDYGFTRNSTIIGAPEALKVEVVRTSEDVIRWKNVLIDYIENKGNHFVEKFSYIPNILAAINDLNEPNGLNYKKLLLGRIDHLFRALVISKLCNDPKFCEKLRTIRAEILQTEYVDWHPYLERLERKLELIKPIYDDGTIYP